MSDTDARLWHPWLCINRVLRVMLQTRWSAEAWALRRTGRGVEDTPVLGHDFLADPVIGDRSDTVLHARTSVRLVMRIRRSPSLSGSPSGHIDPRVVSYARTRRSCHLPPR